MKIYYAHPMSWYNTEEEAHDMEYLRQHFPDDKIVNPNSPWFDAQVRNALIANEPVMKVFTDWIEHNDCAVVVRPFSDGHIGSGVGQEAFTAHLWGKEIYEFTKNGFYWVPFLHIAHDGILTVAATKLRVAEGVK